jgi:outer membrane protein, adhesin transport system
MKLYRAGEMQRWMNVPIARGRSSSAVRFVGVLGAFAAAAFMPTGVAAQDSDPTPADSDFVRLVASAALRQPDLGSGQAALRQARGSLSAVRADFLPRLQLLVDSGEDRNSRAGADIPGTRRSGEVNPQLALTQLIYDGGAALGRYRAAKDRVGAANFEVDSTSNAVLLRGVQVYFTVLRQVDSVRIARENVEKVLSVRSKVAARAAEGRDPRSEESRLDSRLLEARSQLADAQRDLESTSADFVEFFGESPGALDMPGSYPSRRDHVEDALAYAREHNPQLLSLRAEYEAASADLRAERATLRWPRLSLEVTGTAYDAFGQEGVKNRDTYVGLRVAYDVFNGGANLGRTAQASGRRRGAELDVQRAELALDRSVRQAYAALLTRERQVALAAERAARDRQAIDDYEELFLAGRRSLNDLIVAQRDSFTSATQLIDIQLDLSIQRYSIAALTGELADYFGLAALADTTRPGGH